MPQYDIKFRTEDGREITATKEGDLQQIAQEAQKIGLTPIKVRPAIETTSTTSTTAPSTTSTTQPSEPGLGTDVVSALGQAATGAYMGSRVPGPPAVKMLASGVGGLLGGLGPYAYQRGGMPSKGEIASVATGELLPFMRFVPGVGPLVERGSQAVGRTVGRALEPIRRPAAQALEASGLIRDASSRAVGAINRQPTQMAGDLLNRIKGVVRTGTEKRVTTETVEDVAKTAASRETSDVTRIPMDTGQEGATRTLTEAQRGAQKELGTEAQKTVTSRIDPMMKDVLDDTLKTYGLDISKMTEKEFLAELEKSPERVAAGIAAFETASGQRLVQPGELPEMWVGHVMQGAGKKVGEAARRGRGLLIDPGGAYVLDGTVVSDAWKGLTDQGRMTFGPKFADAFNGLVEKLAKLPKSGKGVSQLTREHVPMMAPFAAITKFLQSPVGAGATAGGSLVAMQHLPGIIEKVSEHPYATGAGALVAGTVAGIRIGRRGAQTLMKRILSTDAGLTWLAEGVDMMGKRMPSIMIADAMSRSLSRSPQLLQSLGIGGGGAPPQTGPMPPGLFQSPQMARQ